MQYKKLIILLLITSFNINAKCIGKFINPITDLCWSCLFPLSIGPVTVNKSLSSSDPGNPKDLMCLCPRPSSPVPVPGVPVGFWEPVRMVDVTRTPYCLVGMGGLCFSDSSKKGTHSITGDQKRAKEHSFYHVHWYIYPVIYWLELLTDFLCLDKRQIDLAYLTELDPTWHDDEISALLSPEVFLFANPLAQAACSVDCATASVSYSRDAFFWCAGCQGGMYPFTGSVEHHAGGVQASLLLTQRIAAKMHRQGMAMGTCGREALCGKYVMPVIRKKQYRTQMVYPRAATNKELGWSPNGQRQRIIRGRTRISVERRRLCIFHLEEKELLHFIVLLTLFGAKVYSHELDDLIKSQDAVVKQYMPELQDFMNQANKNAARYQLSAEGIIKNSKANCNQTTNFDWLHGLAVTGQQSAPPNSELYVFASLSIPKTRLIELIKEATKYNGAVVLRGLKNNSYKDTALFLQPIIEQAGAGFIIDPTLFTQYNITTVPVFVLNDPLIKQHDKIAGNISLQYALQEFAKNGDLKNTASQILEAVK